MTNPTVVMLNLPGIPGANYPASPLTPVVDAKGKEFINPNGRLVPNGPFGVRVYMRATPTSQWQMLYFREGNWGQLYVINGQLRLYFTTSQWQVGYAVIPQYVAK